MFDWQIDESGTFTIVAPQARITLSGEDAARTHQLAKAWLNLCFPHGPKLLTADDYDAGKQIILTRLWNTYKGVK